VLCDIENEIDEHNKELAASYSKFVKAKKQVVMHFHSLLVSHDLPFYFSVKLLQRKVMKHVLLLEMMKLKQFSLPYTVWLIMYINLSFRCHPNTLQ